MEITNDNIHNIQISLPIVEWFERASHPSHTNSHLQLNEMELMCSSIVLDHTAKFGRILSYIRLILKYISMFI